MSYDSIRLELPDETVVCYFAPAFEVNPTDNNDIFNEPLPNEQGSLSRDNGLWTSELTVQGAFHHSDSVGADFRNALQDLFGQQTVTPMDQINRLRSFTVYDDPGNLHLYHRQNEYTAVESAETDIENGVYPAVTATELRTPEEGETSATQAEFTVRLSVGFEEGG